MGHELHPIVQAAVRFYIQVGGIAVGNVEKMFGVGSALAALVDLQLYAELPQAFTVEDEIRDIVVIMDRAFCAGLIIAILAEVLIIIFEDMFVVDELVAAIAAGVVPLAAGSAQKAVAVSFIVLQINADAAFITKSCQPGSTCLLYTSRCV